MSVACKLGLAALLASLHAPAAAATIVISSSAFDPLGHRNGTIIYAPENFTATVDMGRSTLSGIDMETSQTVKLLSYSLDILAPLSGSDFTLEALSSVISNPVKLSQIGAMMNHADPIANSPNKSAAVQMAIWEIIYEPGTSGYNIATGQFRVRGGNSGTARALANNYLANVTGGEWAAIAPPNPQVAALFARDSQLRIVRIIAPVPEPAAWAMMIGGVGVTGAVLRRRRDRALRPAAMPARS